MPIIFYPSTLSGSIPATPSKSFAQRAIISAAFAGKNSTIYNISFSDDIVTTINALNSLGAKFNIKKNSIICKKAIDANSTANVHINCNQSGLVLRFFIAITSFLPFTSTTFHGHPSLFSRNLEPLFKFITSLGGIVTHHSDRCFSIFKSHKSPILSKEHYDLTVDCSCSSQFLSGLLFTFPLIKKSANLYVNNTPVSKPYIAMSLHILSLFKIHINNNSSFTLFSVKKNSIFIPQSYYVEGDFSQASLFLSAATIKSSRINITNLNPHSLQGDKKIVPLLSNCGAKLTWHGPSCSVLSSSKTIKGFSFNLINSPDLFPILAVLACFAKSPSYFHNFKRLTFKESNRITSTAGLVSALGAKLLHINSKLVVIPIHKSIINAKHTIPFIKSFNDHRIAMATAIAALNYSSPIILDNQSCIDKSYPLFLSDYFNLGGKYNVINLV